MRTLMVQASVVVLLFISLMCSLNNCDLNTGDVNLDWLSPLFALLVIALVRCPRRTARQLTVYTAHAGNRKKEGF